MSEYRKSQSVIGFGCIHGGPVPSDVAKEHPQSHVVCALGKYSGHPTPNDCTQCPSYEGQSRGLGDSVASVTKKFGIKPCAPCQKRREKLNKMFPKKANRPISETE